MRYIWGRDPADEILGEAFRPLARSYLINGLEKGVPSLFVDVKGVYIDYPEKMAVVGEIVEEIIGQLSKDLGLHDDGISPAVKGQAFH